MLDLERNGNQRGKVIHIMWKRDGRGNVALDPRSSGFHSASKLGPCFGRIRRSRFRLEGAVHRRCLAPTVFSRCSRLGSVASWSAKMRMAIATTATGNPCPVGVSVDGSSIVRWLSPHGCRRAGSAGCMAVSWNRHPRRRCRHHISRRSRSPIRQAQPRPICRPAPFNAAGHGRVPPVTMRPGVRSRSAPT